MPTPSSTSCDNDTQAQTLALARPAIVNDLLESLGHCQRYLIMTDKDVFEEAKTVFSDRASTWTHTKSRGSADHALTEAFKRARDRLNSASDHSTYVVLRDRLSAKQLAGEIISAIEISLTDRVVESLSPTADALVTESSSTRDLNRSLEIVVLANLSIMGAGVAGSVLVSPVVGAVVTGCYALSECALYVEEYLHGSVGTSRSGTQIVLEQAGQTPQLLREMVQRWRQSAEENTARSESTHPHEE